MSAHAHPMRVLVRPTPTPPLPPQPPPHQPSAQNGVVVVGFIGKRHDDVSHLINRIVDNNVFGSGNIDKNFPFEGDKIDMELQNWFNCRKLSFYNDEEKGILYLQFTSNRCPVTGVEFDSIAEDYEFGDLQGLLFMFSVCHVIILIQEGSRFDTQMLQKFRVLQAAKQAMAPFVRSQNTPPVTSRPRNSTAPSRISNFGQLPNNPSPVKTRGILNRNVIMSGLGSSYASFLPGQCTPVVLFVFLDDFTEFQNNENSEEIKGSSSNSIVVLSRPVNKSDNGFKKKLQSSLEAQIRFSIKKCRTLSENGSRNGGNYGFAPLFSLDASKAVTLVDSYSSQSGESLEFTIGLIEEILNGRANQDSLLLESHKESANKEDILSVREFISKQFDILRGRGNLVNSTTGGVGIAAAAAAAAAASATASSRNTVNAPELPSFDKWLSSCNIILHKILSVKRSCLYENDPFVSLLDSGVGPNARFSKLWCEKAFPIAKEVYLDDLPPLYPSFQHEERLNKALRAFKLMVKGPSVPLYIEKLRDECTSIWTSGRQLCDAISLMGQPCTHERHLVETKPHSSGVVYLHACACGRSRRLRVDPFDYETANVGENVFADCDKHLPSVQLPKKGIVWNLIRVGSAKYYDPNKGLIQSGFSANHRFLLKWNLFHEELKKPNESLENKFRELSLEAENKKTDGRQIRETETKNTSVGRGIFNFTMKKPFSEVVSGSTADSSAFPPLFSRNQHKKIGEMGNIWKVENVISDDTAPNVNVVPENNIVGIEEARAASSVNHVAIYVGFEHECPHGHRFILNSDHLIEPALPEENSVPLSVENSDKKFGKNGGYGRTRRQANGKIKNPKDRVANGRIVKEQINGSDRVKDLDTDHYSTARDDGDFASLLNRNIPIYMNCPHCRDSTTKNGVSGVKFASTISQLQRIFVVTPSLPILLAADPVIQFEVSCLPPTVPDRENKLQFSLGCPVILPPESFLSLRLPFIYGVEFDDKSVHYLKPFENQPQLTAWIIKDTALRVVSKRSSLDP